MEKDMAYDTMFGPNPEIGDVFLHVVEYFEPGIYGPKPGGKRESFIEIWDDNGNGFPAVKREIPLDGCGPGIDDVIVRVQSLTDSEGVVCGVAVTVKCDDILQTATRYGAGDKDLIALRGFIAERKSQGAWK